MEEIRKRFDSDVESFSNIETGQQAIPESTLILNLLSDSAPILRPDAKNILDVGCGAGNLSLKVLGHFQKANCTLMDLSLPMLKRAQERVSGATSGKVSIIQSDMKSADVKENSIDLIISSMAIHHMRNEAEWRQLFNNFNRWLTRDGVFLNADLVTHKNTQINNLQRQGWGNHLESFQGAEYRDLVLEFSECEDSPTPLLWQMNLLTEVGFKEVDILYKRYCFAIYYASK